MVRAAVLGSPVAHSLSPLLHRAAYASLGLDWAYDAIEVRPEGLAAFLDGLGSDWAGLSLTMPLKQAVLPLLDERDGLVERTGSANTVVLSDGRRSGHNTDVHGLVAALREAGVEHVDRAAVVGTGATAASALAALHDLGAHQVRVLGRDRAKIEALRPVAVALGVELRPAELHPLELEDRWPQLVISSVPAGVLDDFAAASDPGPDPPLLLDVTYEPWPSPLAAAYAAAGGTVVPGTAMLLHQAGEQVRLMTGLEPPIEDMRAALTAR
ncbi:MAG TPA: shikimate dehydrogenase [Mycobacteriales bacterium]|nr:shikimate dehydrogenase [Mycobacteriales bacterium]